MNVKIAFMRFVIILSMLCLAGCAGRGGYAAKLNLPNLPAPAVLVPATTPPNSRGVNGTLFEYENLIRAASTTADIDKLDGQLQAMKLVGGQMKTANPGMNDAGKAASDCMDYLEQATQIKIAEIQDGDAADASGEVESRLKAAHQLALNSDALDLKSGAR